MKNGIGTLFVGVIIGHTIANQQNKIRSLKAEIRENNKPFPGMEKTYHYMYKNGKTLPPKIADISFPDRKDAERICRGLIEIICDYGFASIADYYGLCNYGLCNYETFDFRNTQYGWTIMDLPNIIIAPNYERAYSVKLPKPQRFE